MFMFVLFYRICTHVRLGILATSLNVYACFVFEGIYTCKIRNVGDENLYSFTVFIQGMYTYKPGNVGNVP